MMVVCAWIGSVLAAFGFGVVAGEHLKGSLFSLKKCPNLYSTSESRNNSKV